MQRGPKFRRMVPMLEFGTPRGYLTALAILVPWLKRGARVRFSALSAVI